MKKWKDLGNRALFAVLTLIGWQPLSLAGHLELNNGLGMVWETREATNVVVSLRLAAGRSHDHTWPGVSILYAKTLESALSDAFEVRQDIDAIRIQFESSPDAILSDLEQLQQALQKADFAGLDLDQAVRKAEEALKAKSSRLLSAVEERLLSETFHWPVAAMDSQPLRSYTAVHLKKFHETHVCPRKTRMSFVGPMEKVEIDKVAARLNRWRSHCAVETPAAPAGKPTMAKSQSTSPQTVVVVGQRLPTVDPADHLALESLAFAYGGSQGSRLNKELRERLGLVYMTGSKVVFLDDGALIYFLAVCAGSSSQRVQRILTREFASLVQGQVNKVSYAIGKKRFRMDWLFELEHSEVLAKRLNDIAAGENFHAFMNRSFESDQSQSGSELRRIRRKYLQAGTRTQFVMGLENIRIGS